MEELKSYDEIMKDKIEEYVTGDNWVREVLGIFKDLIVKGEEKKEDLHKKAKDQILRLEDLKEIPRVTYFKKTERSIISESPGYGGIRFVIKVRDCGEVEACVKGKRNILWKETFQSLEGNINIPGVMKFYLNALLVLFNIRIFI